ncbi:MAG: ribosome small subunit-dependent GTPase A [Bacilli bacterium]|nr:ribosome small subunit-dependent GTPase A [Bacilli bacterium]
MIGRIVKLISNDYTVIGDQNCYVCKSRGKFRNQNISPKVGDMVEIDPVNQYILRVLPRKNELVRPPVSNIDQVIIITSVKHPDFSTNLLDKLLTIIEYHNIKPLICFTKLDLLSEHERPLIERYMNYYQIYYDCYQNTELEQIKQSFQDKITVFTGQSGAGKSTLLNHLDEDLHIKTNEISMALGRGKHTTRHVELLPLYGGYVADTPGFSDIEFTGMSKQDIRDNFEDFNSYRDQCRYKDCLHDKEDHCMIKDKVAAGVILQERYDNYLKFLHQLPEKKY